MKVHMGQGGARSEQGGGLSGRWHGRRREKWVKQLA